MIRVNLKMLLLVCVISQGFLSGCATIVKGTTQNIPIASDPPDADVTVDGQLVGQTPIDIPLARKRDHLVTVAKEGFEPKSIAITKSVGGAVWGNILAGGLIGWGIDASSGAQYNLNPESISVRLDELADGAIAESSQDSKADFVTRLNELDELKEQGKVSDEEYDAIRTSLFREYYPELDVEAPEVPPDTTASAPAGGGDTAVDAQTAP